MNESRKIDVFISHHTASSLPVTKAIAEYLEARGLRCWYAPRNTTGLYASSIMDAISAARVFILILNRESSASFDVLNEVENACERLRRGEPLEIIPFHTGGDLNELRGDILYYIKRMHWIDARTPPLEASIRELAERVFAILKRPPEVVKPTPGPTEPVDLSPVDLEGRVLDAPSSLFLPRADHEGDGFSEHFSCLDDGSGEEIPIPYREILGSGKAGVEEYREGVNLTVEYEDWRPPVKDRIEDYAYKRAMEFEKGRKAHYLPETSPSALCLSAAAREALSVDGPWFARLRLRFGESNYYDHRLYRQLLNQDGGRDRQEFLTVLRQAWGMTDCLNRPMWGYSGGGIWLLTADGYLAMSYRNPDYLLEEPGKLGYSASGSYNRFIRAADGTVLDGTPAGNIVKEMGEELGIPADKVDQKDLTLISFGIDAARYLIQLSHFWRCPYTKRQIVRWRKQAPTAMEQYVFFVPFRAETINRFLQTCEFEPGAAWSLMRLRQKYLDGADRRGSGG